MIKYQNASSCETIDVENGASIIKGSNVSVILNPKAKDSLYLSGNYMVTDGTMPYYHLVIDVIGSFVYIKKTIKDLKLLFLITPDMDKPGSLIDFMIKNYPSEVIYLDQDNTKNIEIEHQYILIFKNMMPELLKSATHIIRLGVKIPIVGTYRNEIAVMVSESIREIILSKYPSATTPQKIYSIRNTSRDKNKLFDPVKSTEKYGTMLKDPIFNFRIHAEEYKVADYFESIGYSVINFAELTFIEQVQHAVYATHYAGFLGANMTNAIFMNPSKNSNVIMLYGSSWYSYPYDEYYRSLNMSMLKVNDEIAIMSPRIKSNYRTDEDLSKFYQTPASEIIAQLDQLVL